MKNTMEGHNTAPVKKAEEAEVLEVVEPRFKKGQEIMVSPGLRVSIEGVSNQPTYSVTVHLEDGTVIDTIYSESELLGLEKGEYVVDSILRVGMPVELSPGSKVQLPDSDAVYEIVHNAPNGLIMKDVDTGINIFVADKNSVISA